MTQRHHGYAEPGKHGLMTFVPRNLHFRSDYMSEWVTQKGRKYLKVMTSRTARRAVKLDLRKREW